MSKTMFVTNPGDCKSVGEQGIAQEAKRIANRQKDIDTEIKQLKGRFTELEEKLVEEINSDFLTLFPRIIIFKVEYEELVKEYDRRRKTSEAQRDKEQEPYYEALRKSNTDYTYKVDPSLEKHSDKACKEYWKRYAQIDEWCIREKEKINLRVDKFLTDRVENIAMRLLLAHHINRVPQKGFAILYEQSGYERNRCLKMQHERLGVSEFFRDGYYSDGDRFYAYTENAFDLVHKTVFHEFQDMFEHPELVDEFLDIPDKISRLQEELKLLGSTSSNLKKSLSGYDIVRKYGYDPKMIEKVMPWLLDEVAATFSIKDLKVLVEEGVAVFLEDVSYTNHGPGCEYGVRVTVYRDNPENKAGKYFCWRDPYHASNDRPAYNFRQCEVVEVSADTIQVKLVNCEFQITETFTLSKNTDVEMK